MTARQGFIGQSVVRREDSRFLTGRGQYTDDITLPGQAYGHFLRSPYAHARIRSISTTAAAALACSSVSATTRATRSPT